MNFTAENKQITASHSDGYVYPGGLTTYRKINGLHPVLKHRAKAFGLKPLFPVEILRTNWNKWNEPDEIVYKSLPGINYVIYDNNLLADITEFMQQNGQKGTLPHLHIEGEDGWECYTRPAKSHILEFLRAYLSNYDIYSVNDDLVQEANERRKFNLCVELEQRN
jgi:hypothetical protein